MSTVTARTQRDPAPPPTWRWRALLVLGLLVGVLGMHGLGSAGAGAGAAMVARTSHTATAHSPDQGPSTMSATAATLADESVCHQGGHGEGGPGDCAPGGGHTQHADPTCASTALAAGYVPPAPVADPIGIARATETVDRYVVASPCGGRAPPSLAELQLLRI
jgi:hypothetical protein